MRQKEPTLSDVLNELRQLRREIKSNSKAMLTIPEAAEYLGISPKTIRNGVGPKAKYPFPVKPKRIGKRVLFRRTDLDQFISEMGDQQ